MNTSHTTHSPSPLTTSPQSEQKNSLTHEASPSSKTEKGRNHWQTGSAIAMLTVGTLLSVAGFCVPPVGEISESVLWFFGQCLLYAGSILGVGAYVDRKFHEMRHRTNG